MVSLSSYRPFLSTQIEEIRSLLLQDIQPFVGINLQSSVEESLVLSENQLRVAIEDQWLHLQPSLRKTMSIAEMAGRKVERVQVLAVVMEGVAIATGGILLYHASDADRSLESSHDLIVTRDFGLKQGCQLAGLVAFENLTAGGVYAFQDLPETIGIHTTGVARGRTTAVGIYKRTGSTRWGGRTWTQYRFESRLEGLEEVALEPNISTGPSLADLFKKHQGSTPIICKAPGQPADLIKQATKAGIKCIGVELTPRQYEVRRIEMENLEKRTGIKMIPLLDDEAFDRDAVIWESALALNEEGRYDDGTLENVCYRLELFIKEEEAELRKNWNVIPPESVIARTGYLEEAKARLERLNGPVRQYLKSIGNDPQVYQKDLERLLNMAAREMVAKIRTAPLDMVVIAPERAKYVAELLGAPYYEG